MNSIERMFLFYVNADAGEEFKVASYSGTKVEWTPVFEKTNIDIIVIAGGNSNNGPVIVCIQNGKKPSNRGL